MKDRPGKIHDLSHCNGCGHQLDGVMEKNVGRALQRHANQTGHEITRETAYAFTYRPRK